MDWTLQIITKEGTGAFIDVAELENGRLEVALRSPFIDQKEILATEIIDKSGLAKWIDEHHDW